MICMLDGFIHSGCSFGLECLPHNHDICLLVGRHEHLHLACGLLPGRDLARCLAYGGLVSRSVYYATPYLLHLHSFGVSSWDTAVRCRVSRTELFRDASACPVSILDAYAFQRVLVAPTRASFDSSDRYRLPSGQQQVCGMDLGASAYLIWAPRSCMCALMLIQLVPVSVY